MASALEQLTNNYSTDQAVSFYDYYNAYGRDKYGANNWIEAGPDSIWAKLQNLTKGDVGAAQSAYDAYLSEYEFRKNSAATAKQNAETYAREDSEVTRLVKDLQNAGLNPWLALNGGSLSNSYTSEANAAKYDTQKTNNSKSNNNSTNMLTSALKVILFAMIMAA